MKRAVLSDGMWIQGGWATEQSCFVRRKEVREGVVNMLAHQGGKQIVVRYEGIAQLGKTKQKK